MPQRFSPADYIKITVLGFALTALWSSLHSIVLPLRLLDFVAESEKNTYLGLLTFSGLILAMLAQPIAGTISDHSSFRWGRRRPYILLGTMAAMLFLPGIGLFHSYAAVFVFYCLMQISSNTAQGPYQAFIPELAPQERRGVASGVKTLFEILGGITLARLIGYLMGKYFGGEGEVWLWLSLTTLAIILLGAMAATILTVKEPAGAGGIRLPSPSILYQTFKIDVKLNQDFVWFLVSRLFILMAFATLQTFALYFLKDVVGVENPATVTADLLIAIGAGMLAAVYPAGRLSDRIGRKPIAVTSGLLGALAIAVLFFLHSYAYILACGVLLGISSGAFLSSNWALATDLVPKGEEARYLGLANMATAGGGAAARLIGPVIDFFENPADPGQGYSIMFLGCFIYFILGSLLMLKIKGKKQ